MQVVKNEILKSAFIWFNWSKFAVHNIHFYDIKQAFDSDSMWFEVLDTMEQRDYKFALIAEMNKECNTFVKTPEWHSVVHPETEQQGTVLAPLKCAKQMDSISRECIRYIGFYKFSDCHLLGWLMIWPVLIDSDCV